MLRKPFSLNGLNLFVLAFVYVAAYICVERFVEDPIRHYNFCVFLSLSGIFFSWLVGGKRTMYYVLFFNLFLVVVFSKLLWNHGVIVYKGLFLGRSFITMYAAALVLLLIFVLKKSPADAAQEKQQREFEAAEAHRRNLEFMVASRKLKQDMLAQANLVKDELQLIEGAWRSKVHDIANELPPVKEQALYREVILPYQTNIIRHLRELEHSLTFDLAPVTLDELFETITGMLHGKKMTHRIRVDDRGWQGCTRRVFVDVNKVRDMLMNVLRNSQTALDLKRIRRLSTPEPSVCTPHIDIRFSKEADSALLTVCDNAGGVSAEYIEKLYSEPVLSQKSGGTRMGQGAMFVKFFAEKMRMEITVENISLGGEKGLAVGLRLPFHESSQTSQPQPGEAGTLVST